MATDRRAGPAGRHAARRGRLTVAVQGKAYVVMADHLRHLARSLSQAVETGDLAAIARSDHELRSGVIAFVGASALLDGATDERVRILSEALEAVRAAASKLQHAGAAQAAPSRGTLVYLDAIRRQRSEA